MGRTLKRVPMEFDYPLNRVWYGTFIDCIATCVTTYDSPKCRQCRKMAEIKGIPMTNYGCPDFDTYLEEPMKQLKELLAPPTGDGYQLWETTLGAARYRLCLQRWTNYVNGVKRMKLHLQVLK